MMDAIRFHWANTRQRLLDAGNSPWLMRKTVLRALTVPLALVAFITFAAAIMPWDQSFVHTNSPKGDWQDAIPVGPLVLAFIFNIISILYVLWNAQQVHRILEGVVDFLIGAALVPGIIFAAWSGAFHLWQSPTAGSDGMVFCDLATNASSRECYPQLYQIGERELAGIVFAIPVCIMHTFFFVHGCVEGCTQRRTRTEVQNMARLKELESGISGQSAMNFSRPSRAATTLPTPPLPMPIARYR